MKAAAMASLVSPKVRMSFSIGQPVQIRSGKLAGLSGTLIELPSSGRASIRLHKDVCLEIDLSTLEPDGAE